MKGYGENGKDEDTPRLIEVSTDCVVFGYGIDGLRVMLIEIGAAEHKGKWALPGDRVFVNEDLDQAAVRVLQELTGLENIPLQQAHAFGSADRVPGKRVVTIGFYTIINKMDVRPMPSRWAQSAKWFDVNKIPKLTYDHNAIITYALQKLRNRLRHSNRRTPLWESVLPEHFTLSELQHFYEVVLDRKFDKGNFRKKLNEMPYLIETEIFQTDVSHRPARLYKYDRKTHESYAY